MVGFRSLLFFSFYLLVSFPLFYYVYKFSVPEPIAHDYFQYERIYQHWAIDQVEAPFNMRLAGASIVHLFYKIGFCYDTQTAFDSFVKLGFSKSVFFCSVFFNYLCVTTTCVVIFRMLRRYFSFLISISGGLIFLLGFGTLFFDLMPITDGCSVLLFALIYSGYRQKKGWVFPLLPILVFQREYILLAVGTLALMDFIRNHDRYFLWMVVACIAGLILYYLLRKTFFFTTALDEQISVSNFSATPFLKLPLLPFLKQTFISCNLFVLYLCVVFSKGVKGASQYRYHLVQASVLFLQVILLSILMGHGNNAGRYFYLISPFLIFLLAVEVNSMSEQTVQTKRFIP
jgi:hypothetical protein